MQLQFGGYSFSVDLAGMNGDKATETNATKREGKGPLVIEFEREGFNFSVDLASVAKAESIDEIENQLKCWQYEGAPSSQPEGAEGVSTETIE